MQVVLVWWLSESDCRAIGEPFDATDPDYSSQKIAAMQRDRRFVENSRLPWPDYIKRQFRSRFGRPGRGRLRVDNELGLPRNFCLNVPEEKFEMLFGDELSDTAGIVIRVQDFPLVGKLCGIITDTNLNHIPIEE